MGEGDSGLYLLRCPTFSWPPVLKPFLAPWTRPRPLQGGSIVDIQEILNCTSISSGQENPTSLVTFLEIKYNLLLLNSYTYLGKVPLPSLPSGVGLGCEPQDSCSGTNNVSLPLRCSLTSSPSSVDFI